MGQKSEELKEKNLQNSPVQRYIKLCRFDLLFRSQIQKTVRLLIMYLFKFYYNRLTSVRLVIALEFLCQILYETEKISNHRFLYNMTYFHTFSP